MFDRKSLLVGAAIGLGAAAILFAFRLDQLNRERSIVDIIRNNADAERHKQVLSAINKKSNGKSGTARPTKSDTVNA